MANAGKEFEKQFKESVPKEAYFLRLHDSAIGFGGNRQEGGFAVKSPYDCLLFNMSVGKVFALELKSTKEKSMSFETPTSGKGNKVIKKHQIIELRKAAEKGLIAGFIFNFRSSEKTYFLSIGSFDYITDHQMGKKASINENDIQGFATLIPQRMKKVNWSYDLTVLF